MLIIISKIVFALSFIGILVIIARKLPTLSRLPERPSIKGFSIKNTAKWLPYSADRVVSSNFFQRFVVRNLERFFRKMKVMALRMSNLLDKVLKKLKKNSRK